MANQPHSPVPVLERQVRLDTVTQPAPYSQSFDNAALNPTALGAFGADIAMKASTELSRQRGYEDGLNPKGTLLPPLTNADKAYADAYIAQSQNTLGLQATRLMQEGQAELAKAYQLTPEMLQNYTKNMSEGLNEIIDNAPSQAQPGLAAQFSNSLMQSTGSLNQKMIAQQKQKALQEAAAFNTSQVASIYEAARGGNIGSAETIENDMSKRTNAMINSGMISKSQGEASEKSAKIAKYTGMYTGQAIKAFNEKNVDQFLADLLQKKPKEVSTLEWEAIAKSVMGEVSLYESFQARNETSLYTEGNRLLHEGLLTQEFIGQLKAETTSKSRFNDFMVKVATYQRKNGVSDAKVALLTPNWSDSDAMAIADRETKNKTLIQQGQDQQQRSAMAGQEISEFEGQMYAMGTAGGPVPAFTNKMNSGFKTANSALMLRNLKAYRYLQNANPKVLSEVDSVAEAMMTVFKRQIDDGNEPDVAALNASEIVIKKDKDQLEINSRLFSEWERKNVSTNSRRNSWAANMVDFGVPINNLPSFAQHLKDIFKDNMNLVNGDVDAATEMTERGIKRAWGVTRINGKPEAVFQPIEKTIDADDGALPYIRNDIYNHISRQIEPMAQAFKEGRITFYYRMPERPSFEKFMEAQKLIASRKEQSKPAQDYSQHPLSRTYQPIKQDPEWDAAIAVVDAFNADNVKIEKVFSDKHIESYNLSIAANPALQQTPEGTIDGYNVTLRDNNGANYPLTGWFTGTKNDPLNQSVYMPNPSLIKNMYAEVIKINPTGLTPFEINKNLKSRKEFEREFGLDNPYQRLRGVF